MKILHLTLHRVWFDEIVSGRKKVEYRRVTPYWTKRLEGLLFDQVYFRNGYNPRNPFMRVEWKGLQHAGEYYEILLGKILELRNYREA